MRFRIYAFAGKNLSAEHLIEVNYQANVTPWLILQLVVQWYVKPAGDASREDVFIAGFRTRITF